MLYHVVACARKRVIGKDNRLPWHFSEDLKYFKALTMGSTVIMGRRTYESIGRPLPGRENFVLTRQERVSGNHVHFYTTLDQALAAVRTPDAYVIGGAQVYRETLTRVDGIYLTEIMADYEGDAMYPELPKPFTEKSRKLLREDPKIEAVFYLKDTK